MNLFLLRLATKNLLRQPRRTALSMVAVIAGVAVLILGQGFIGGMTENIIRAQVDTASGHVTVRPLDYPTEPGSRPVDELLDLGQGLAAHLDQAAKDRWTTRTLFTPEAVKGPDSVRLLGVVFDPARDEAVFPRETWTVVGKVPATAADGVLVGDGPAALLGLKAGDTLRLKARTHKGALNALEVPVAGVLHSGNPMFDQAAVFVPLPLGEELLRLSGKASHVHVRLDWRDGAVPFATALSPAMPKESEVVTWQEETKDLVELQATREKALNILVFALLGMSATGIANTVLMAAYERIREVGTLRAMGMTRGQIIGLFMAEGGMMGLLGGLLGGAAGGGIVSYYARVGIDLSSAVKAQGAQFPISTVLYMHVQPSVIVAGVLFGLVVATLASVWPAMVASRMAPADAVRAD